MDKRMLGQVTDEGKVYPELMTNGQPLTRPIINFIHLGQGYFAIAPVSPYPTREQIDQLCALVPPQVTKPAKRESATSSKNDEE